MIQKSQDSLEKKLLRRETGVDVKLQAKKIQQPESETENRWFHPLLFPRTEPPPKKQHNTTPPVFNQTVVSDAADSFQSLLRWKLQILEPHQASDVRSARGRSSWSFLGWNIICCCWLWEKLRCFFWDFGVQDKFPMGLRVWRIGYPKFDDTDIQYVFFHHLFCNGSWKELRMSDICLNQKLGRSSTLWQPPWDFNRFVRGWKGGLKMVVVTGFLSGRIPFKEKVLHLWQQQPRN